MDQRKEVCSAYCGNRYRSGELADEGIGKQRWLKKGGDMGRMD